MLIIAPVVAVGNLRHFVGYSSYCSEHYAGADLLAIAVGTAGVTNLAHLSLGPLGHYCYYLQLFVALRLQQ